MTPNEPKKLTLQIGQALLRRLKICTVSNNYTFSQVVATAVLVIIGHPDRPGHFPAFKEKYHYVDYSEYPAPRFVAYE